MMTAVTACAPWAPTREDSGPARDDPGAAGLVARARGGDKHAWDALVERYAPLIWSMCPHQPPCPPPPAPARTIARHLGQGWSLLCNGVIVFDDTGELLPDGRAVPPRRPTPIPSHAAA